MKKNIKIAVIGGTGKSGQYLVKQLINQGFNLKVLLRNPDKLPNPHPLVEVIQGNVCNYGDVYNLIKDCQAVISTLGLGIPASEPTIFSKSTTNVLKAMNELMVQRYIVITGLNVDTQYDRKGPKTAMGTEWMRKTFPTSTSDKQSEYEILETSNVNWTMVRLPLIDQTDEINQIRISLEDCPGDKISATSLAVFLIEQLTTKDYIKKAPFIANG